MSSTWLLQSAAVCHTSLRVIPETLKKIKSGEPMGQLTAWTEEVQSCKKATAFLRQNKRGIHSLALLTQGESPYSRDAPL
jgi:hypothetical protein